MLTSMTFFPDLKALSIHSCPSVTPEGILSVLSFPFLPHFEYYTRTPVFKSFVRGNAAQNPSLQDVSDQTTRDMDNNHPGPTNNNLVDNDNWVYWSAEEKKSFFKKNPRIKALHNLVSIHYDLLLWLVSSTLARCLCCRNTSECMLSAGNVAEPH